MEHLNEIIRQNYNIAFIAALILIFIAGLVFKKSKIFSIILLITALCTIYTVAGYNKIKNIDIKDIKNKVKHKVIEKLD